MLTCECCGYIGEEDWVQRTQDPSTRRTYTLCNLCINTPASISYETNPRGFQTEVLQTLNYVGNLILDELRTIRRTQSEQIMQNVKQERDRKNSKKNESGVTSPNEREAAP